MKKVILENVRIIVVAIILSLGTSVVFAWTGPTSAPVSGNTPAPLNVNTVSQIKTGGLWVTSLGTDAGLTVGGKLGIGITNPSAQLDINNSAASVALSVHSTYATDHWPLRVDTNSANYSGFWEASDDIKLFLRDDAGNLNVVINPDSDSYFTGGNVGIGTKNPTEKLDVAGNVQATAFYYSSDKTLKNNIQSLSGSLNKILKLQGVSFDWKENNRPSIGLIAQDVEIVYPELVTTNEGTGLKSVEYANLVAPLIESIKEQQKQIEELRSEVQELKNK